jgi:hypothetical protein
MSQKLQDVFDGRVPYDWQLDAAEALILGLDCVVIARPVLDFILDPYFSGLTAPCCDLCVMKKFADSPDSLTSEESYILALRDRIMTRKGPADQTPQENGDQPGTAIDVDAQQPPARNGAGEGPRRGDRLEACRNALKSWRTEIWMRDFRRSGLMPEAILPDRVLSKLATHARLKTRNLIKEEIPGWILADQYGEDIIKVLEPIDRGWIEENEQRKEENRAKRAKQTTENKIRREENARAARRQASDERRAASQHLQSSAISPTSQPLHSYTPGAAPLAYPSYYPIGLLHTQAQYIPLPLLYAPWAVWSIHAYVVINTCIFVVQDIKDASANFRGSEVSEKRHEAC